MAWIESHQELGRHPKTKRLARAAGIGIPAAIGHLHLLWWWAMDFAQDGELTNYTDEDIADAAIWDGIAHEFMNALIEAGFIDGTEGNRRIHDWWEYAGRLIDKREQNRERMKRARAAKAAEQEERRNNQIGTLHTRSTHNDAQNTPTVLHPPIAVISRQKSGGNQMSKRKFKKGAKVKSLDDFMKYPYFIVNGKTFCAGWCRGWQLNTAMGYISSGRAFVAERLTNGEFYNRKTDEQLIEILAENGLCTYCPIPEELQGIHQTPTGYHACEGSRCYEALEHWKEEHVE